MKGYLPLDPHAECFIALNIAPVSNETLYALLRPGVPLHLRRESPGSAGLSFSLSAAGALDEFIPGVQYIFVVGDVIAQLSLRLP